MQRVARHADLAARLRYAFALIQQGLRPRLHLHCEHRRRAPPRLSEEPRCPLLPVQLHVPLHGRQGNSESTNDISLPHRPVGD